MRKFVLALGVVASLTGCSHNDYYSSDAPSGYYYSDPNICEHGAVCPLLIAAAIGGVVAATAHH